MLSLFLSLIRRLLRCLTTAAVIPDTVDPVVAQGGELYVAVPDIDPEDPLWQDVR